MMETSMNAGRKCVVCLTVQQQATFNSTENAVFLRFCDTILPPETLDELRSIQGDEFETACTKCEHKLLSILKTNENMIEEGKRINSLCEDLVGAIQMHVATDGSSMLIRLENLEGVTTEEQSSRTVTASAAGVFKIGMQKVIEKVKLRESQFMSVVASMRKLIIGTVEASAISRTEGEIDSGKPSVSISASSLTCNFDEDEEGKKSTGRTSSEDETQQQQQQLSNTVPLANIIGSSSCCSSEGNAENQTVNVNQEVEKEGISLLEPNNNNAAVGLEVMSNMDHDVVSSAAKSAVTAHDRLNPIISVFEEPEEEVVVTPTPIIIPEEKEDDEEEDVDIISFSIPNEDDENQLSQKVVDPGAVAGSGMSNSGYPVASVLPEQFAGITTATTSSSMMINLSTADDGVVNKKNLMTMQLPLSPLDAGKSAKDLERKSGSINKSTKEAKEAELTDESCLGIDHTTLGDAANELLTAFEEIDLEKIKLLIERDDVQEVLKQSTSPENWKMLTEYREVSTLVHKCVNYPINYLRFFNIGDENTKVWTNEDKIEVIEALLTVNKSLLEARDDCQCPPIVTKDAHPDIIAKLIEFGADPFAVDCEGRTFLHFLPSSHLAKYAHQGDWVIWKFLLDLDVDIISRLVLMKDSYGRTPLLAFMDRGRWDKPWLFACDILQVFKEAGADFNSADADPESNEQNNSPLSLAIVSGFGRKVIEFIVGHCGESLLWRGEGNKSLVHLAAQYGNKEAVDFLIEENEFDVNVEDVDGLTPLDYLAFKVVVPFECSERYSVGLQTGYSDIGLVLKQRGGNFNFPVKSGSSAYETSNCEQDQSLLLHCAAGAIELGISDCSNWWYCRYPAWSVELLLRLNYAVNGKNVEGNTPLHAAFQSIVDAHKGNTNNNEKRGTKSVSSLTPLLWLEKKETIKVLLRFGADVDAINGVGKTAREVITRCGVPRWRLSQLDDLIAESEN